MSEVKICANRTCKESSRNSRLQFFGFPKNPKTFRLWVERSGREDLLKKPQTSNKRFFLCEKHFNKFEIKLNGKKSLPYDALPLEFGKIFKKNLSRFRTHVRSSPLKNKTVSTVKKNKTPSKKIDVKLSDDTVATKGNISIPDKKRVLPAMFISISPTKYKKIPSKKTEVKLSNTAVEVKGSSPDKKRELSATVVNTPKQVAKKHTSSLSQRSSSTIKLSTKNLSNLNRVEKEFNVDVFKDVDPHEITNYKKLFPKLDGIADRPVHCTSCNSHIGTAPINEAIIKMHPVLRVIQCKKCYTFYTSGEFERGEDGSEFYCRWCGQGGEVYCCSKCPKVFCRRCIEQNLPKGKVDEIQNNENWICFACDPSCMTQLKADYWALLNFIEKQKKEITNKSLTEKELHEAMSKDCSTCCVNVKKRMYGKRKLFISSDSPPPAKRQDMGPTPPPTIINDALAKKAQNKKPMVPDGIQVQCSPDIGIMLNSADNNSKPDTPSVRLVRHLKVVPITSTTHTVLPASQTLPQSTLLDVHTAPPTKNPVFHTINGFRVDLNSAAQQETFRLPNGKLIQVRKQQPALPNASKISTPATTSPTVAVSNVTPTTVNSPMVVPLAMITSKPATPVPSPPLMRIPPPPLLIRRGRGRPALRARGRGRGSVAITQMHQIPPPVPFQAKQMIEIRRNVKSVTNHSQTPENQIHITSLSQTTRKRKKPGNPPKVTDNSPVNKAKTQFEGRVDHSIEVCEHIIGKMKTLTGSTAFKSVKTLTDIKDLNIHLSYLLTYAVGRFKTLQEKCDGDMKEMGFDPECAKSDDDDIEILEPNTTLIDLDSDDNEGDALERETRKAVENLLNVENMETNVLDTVENVEKTVSGTVEIVEKTVSGIVEIVEKAVSGTAPLEKVTESTASLIQKNVENNGAKEAEKIIADKQPEGNNKTSTETITVADGYDIVEIHETPIDDESEKEYLNKDSDKNMDTGEVNKPDNDVSSKLNTESANDDKTENSIKDGEKNRDSEEVNKPDNDVSGKLDTETANGDKNKKENSIKDGEKNKDSEEVNKSDIDLTDDDNKENSKKAGEENTDSEKVNKSVIDLSDTETVTDDDRNKNSKRGEENIDSEEVKPVTDLGAIETVTDDDKKENRDSEEVKPDKDLTDKNDTAQEEPVVKDETKENDINLTKRNENGNEDITDLTKSSKITPDSGVIDIVAEIPLKDEIKNETETTAPILISEINPDKKPDERVAEISKKSPNIKEGNTSPELMRNEGQSEDSSANEATSQQDTETEQLQKLLEENDDIESPSIENLSGELNEQQQQQQPLLKNRTISEITINVSNVESIDEDIFENLIEEVNEVGDNTNDESLISEINEGSENSSNGDDNILEDIDLKTNEKSKDSLDATLDTEQIDDLSECEENVNDDNDLDLSLSSEIVLDPETDKGDDGINEDDEMDDINEDDEKNLGGIEYIEEEIVENYEIINETSDSMTGPTAKESIDLDSSL